eukprot:353554-Chlamydomonas_euryale.AAC.4
MPGCAWAACDEERASESTDTSGPQRPPVHRDLRSTETSSPQRPPVHRDLQSTEISSPRLIPNPLCGGLGVSRCGLHRDSTETQKVVRLPLSTA